MQSRVDVPLKEESEIRHLAIQELRRGRPLMIVSNFSDLISTNLHNLSSWITGFEFKRLAHKSKHPDIQYVDWKKIYFIKDFSLNLFYGPGNNSNIIIRPRDLEKHDKDGTLIESILGLNVPGRLGAEEAEGIGLIAACMEASYIPAASSAEAKNLLQMLSPDARKECLRHALLFSCYSGERSLVEGLLKLGANPNVTSDEDGSMPLEIATEKENLSLVEAILKYGADPDIELSSGMTCRSLAASINNPLLDGLFAAIPEKIS